MKGTTHSVLLLLAGVALAGAPTKLSASVAALQEAPRATLAAESGVGRLVPNLELVDIDSKRFKLNDLKSAKAIVIAFTSTTCPVTKRYAPTLAALEKEYAARGVRFVFVNPVETDPVSAARESIRANGLQGRYVRDPKGAVTAALGARSTAEVFVLDGARTLVYRGAVDDQYGLGYSLNAPRHKYLAAALDATLSGRAALVQATSAPGCALDPKKASAASVPVTYHARISRIMQQHCVECHRDGGVAPFALGTYDEVTAHAGMIRKQVERGVMPPWFAASHGAGPSPWANDRTLPATDKEDLLAWLGGKRELGNPADAPLPRQFPKEWQIGAPDMVVTIPSAIEVKATGTMPYQNVYVDPHFTEDRWVQEMEVRPTAREVVHHVLVHVVSKESANSKKKRGDNDAGNFFAAYVPGNNVLQFPDGFAKVIPAGAVLHFQIHYTPNGSVTHDQTALGLKFSKSPPLHEVRVAAVAAKLDIPPGEANYVAEGKLPVPFDAKLMAFMPHMHLRGKAYRFDLKKPDGTTSLMLDVPRYDFNWQLQYRLAEFVDAPGGSMLLGTAVYDNSANNPANPNPEQRVKWGEQTDDEMMLGYFEYYVPSITPGTKTPSIREMAMRDGALIFNHLDKNHDGKLTIEESPSAEQFKQADADHDDTVTREEFKVYWQARQQKEKAAKG